MISGLSKIGDIRKVVKNMLSVMKEFDAKKEMRDLVHNIVKANGIIIEIQVSSVRFEGVFDPLNIRKYKAEMNDISKNAMDVDDSNDDYVDYEYLDSDDEI